MRIAGLFARIVVDEAWRTDSSSTWSSSSPEPLGDGIEAAVVRYVATTRATQQLVVLTSV